MGGYTGLLPSLYSRFVYIYIYIYCHQVLFSVSRLTCQHIVYTSCIAKSARLGAIQLICRLREKAV